MRPMQEKDGDEDDVEMGEGVGTGRSPFMKEFFNKVEQVKRNMDQIKKNMINLDKKHGRLVFAYGLSVRVNAECMPYRQLRQQGTV